MTNTSPNLPQNNASQTVRDGLIFGVFAYSLWGLFPIYLKAVGDASALEILSHRILWSVPFGAVLISARNQWGDVKAAFTNPRVLGLLAICALAISANWMIYVWAVINNHVLDASLGYYINPLMYVATGVFILKERLRPTQIIAVSIAAAGVLILTFGVGSFPWISFALAALFTVYGFLRKTIPVGAMPGLFVETTLLSPIALIYLAWLISVGGAAFLATSTNLNILLILAGPVTVIPLLLFALTARRLTLTTLGFLQYIGPTIQFCLGLYFGETFTWAHGICFGLIWTSLAIFSFDALRANRAAKLA